MCEWCSLTHCRWQENRRAKWLSTGGCWIQKNSMQPLKRNQVNHWRTLLSSEGNLQARAYSIMLFFLLKVSKHVHMYVYIHIYVTIRYVLSVNMLLLLNRNQGGSPGQHDSVGWALSRKAKGCQFNSQSGHMPGPCGPGPWLQACERQPTDVALAHRCFPPSLSPSLPLSLKK